MVKPITMKTALRRSRQRAPSATMPVLERFIKHVNTQMATKEQMERYRCSPNVGHFYQIHTDMEATQEDCLAIDTAFLEAGWPGVHVVYYKGRLGVSLSMRPWGNKDPHHPAYNGKTIARQA